MTDDKIYETLRQMSDELRESHRAPSFIPYTDILSRRQMSRGELNSILNSLYLKHKIRVHRGLNDKLIEIR